MVAVLDAAVCGGYAVDLDALDSAVRTFQRTSDSLSALGLPPTATADAGVHGALASVVAGVLGTASTSLADVSGRLRAMAENYRRVEAWLAHAIEAVDASRSGTDGPGSAALILPGLVPGPRPVAENGGAPGPAGLASGWEAARIAMALGASAAHETPSIQPRLATADADRLRATASDWFAVAAHIDDHQQAAAAAADALGESCAGPAIEAFREKTAGLFTSRPSRSETVVVGAPLMDQAAACCRLLGRAHDAAAALW